MSDADPSRTLAEDSLGPRGIVGASVPRREDPRLTSGAARYCDDLSAPGMLHLRLVRSNIAHGLIRAVNVAEWEPLPAGTRVFTGADCRGLGIAADLDDEQWRRSTQPLLAHDRVRYVGEPLAAVLHPDAYVAEDAAELVDVEIEELTPAIRLEDVLDGRHPPMHDGWDDNFFLNRRRVYGDMSAARQRGTHTVRRVFRNHRQAGVPLENRGCLAVPSATGDALTLWSSTQMPHLVRTVVSKVLSLPEGAIRVVAPDVGGGFGVKGHAFAEEVLACWLALRTGRPVKWSEDRGEHLLASIHARDHAHLVEAYVDDDAKVHGIKLQVVVDAGAYSVYPWTACSDSGMVAKVFPGVYDLQNYEVMDVAVATNKCPLGTYRGVGRPSAVFTMERLMDEIAAELGLDRVEVRRRNLISEFPYETANGLLYDPGSYRESLDLAAETIGYRPRSGRSDPPSDASMLVGVGFAVYNEQTAHGTLDFAIRKTPIEAGYQSTTVRVDPDGTVNVYTGLQSHGQSLETTLAQVAAEELGVPLETVRVVHGDTANSPYAMGTWGSRGAVLGGGSVAKAAGVVRQKVRRIAAHLLEADPDDVEIAGGVASVRGAAHSGVSVARVAYVANRRLVDLPPDTEPGLEATASIDGPPRGTFSNSCHAAVVEVDRSTGRVRVRRYVVVEDCGTVINPTVVDGQVHGGVAQGIGSAMLEEFEYGPDGQPLTSTFVDYLLPTATDVPDIEVLHLSTPSPWTVGGRKGMGEAGAIGPMAAIGNAVADALGTNVWETPLRLGRVAALLAADGADGGWGDWAGLAALRDYWSG